MKSWKIMKALGLLGALLIALGLISCGLLEPKESTPEPNQPPDTFITSGPRESSQYSYFVRIAWKGEDADGFVTGYNLVVDGTEVFVTKTDSTFHFSAPNQDTQHTISVAAVDNKDAVDPTPATLTFTAINVPPNTSLEITGNPAPGATFGRGGIFTVIATDDPDNGNEFSFRYKIDDGAWSDWFASNEGKFDFEFSIFSQFGLLPEGQHTFFAQVRDRALAVDETPAEFPFFVSTEVKPVVELESLFNGESFFEDSSAFSFPSGNTVSLTWSPIFDYAGAASSGSRYRVDGGEWTEYSTEVSSLELTNVTPGSHTFEVQYRDLGGVESDVKLFSYEIVAPTFAEGILVVDDGDGIFAGRPPATGDENVDNFYTEVLNAVGAQFTLWDIKIQGNPTPGRGIGRYSTIIWESDEAFLGVLPQQTKLVSDYLSLGGNIWIAGWKPIQQIGGATPVSNFDPSLPNQPTTFSFIWNFLKIASTRQTPGAPADFIGATGLAGHPDLNVDAAKNPIPIFENRLTPIDVFTIRGDVPEAESIYTFVSSSGTDFQGEVTGMKYLGNDFKVVVFGFPFYHMKIDEAIEAARKILTDFNEI
ncbi:MAG: hypothetical protein ACE5NG_09270 [bacterium]